MNTEEKLPEGWVWTTLDDVVLPERIIVRPGENPRLPFIGLEHVEAEIMRLIGNIVSKTLKSTTLHFLPGDVLYGRLRPYLNKVLRPDFEGLCSAEFLVFRQSVNLNSSYLQYFLNSWNFKEFASHQITGDRPRVHWEQLKVFNFPLPPLPEQSRIVAAIEQQFTRLDNGIASLQSAKAKFKQYRASLLKSAVEGELTKDWRAEHPTEETGEQLLKRILTERRARWEEEQLAKMREKGITPKDDKWKQGYKEPQGPDVEKLPELPEGWCWATVEQLAAAEENSITDGPFGSNLKTEHYKDSGPRVIRLQNIGDGFFRDEKAFISQDHFDKLRKHQIFAGDLVIAALGDSPPRSCIIPDFVGSAIVKADCIRYKVSPYILNTYVNIVLNSEPTKKRTSAMLHGIGRPRLNLSEIKSIIIAVPPLAEQKHIMSEVEASLSNIAKLEEVTDNSIKRAEHERQSILREAFAGRLVPQDPNDEPASVLLERIREERKQREEAEKANKLSRKGGNMEFARKRRGRKTGAGKQEVGLYEKLVEVGQPLSPEELFKGVGLKTDEQPESVEVFYQELDRDVADELIKKTRPDDAHVLLEALEPSIAVLVRMEATEEAEQAQEVELSEETVAQPTLWDFTK